MNFVFGRIFVNSSFRHCNYILVIIISSYKLTHFMLLSESVMLELVKSSNFT